MKYITAQDRKEHATAAAGSSVIFDMRGPNARILQTEQVGQLASCDGSLHAVTPYGTCTTHHCVQLRSEVAPLNDGPFPELEHNM